MLAPQADAYALRRRGVVKLEMSDFEVRPADHSRKLSACWVVRKEVCPQATSLRWTMTLIVRKMFTMSVTWQPGVF